MTNTRRDFYALAWAMALGWVLAPLACLAIGAAPFGPGNLIGMASAWFAARWFFAGSQRLDRVKAEFNAAEARREAHALDLPFLESDGSVSRRPETAQERAARVHAELHARRWTAEELSGPLPTGEAELIGSAVMWHAEDCGCVRGAGPGGPVILSKDRRCGVLRSR